MTQTSSLSDHIIDRLIKYAPEDLREKLTILLQERSDISPFEFIDRKTGLFLSHDQLNNKYCQIKSGTVNNSSTTNNTLRISKRKGEGDLFHSKLGNRDKANNPESSISTKNTIKQIRSLLDLLEDQLP